MKPTETILEQTTLNGLNKQYRQPSSVFDPFRVTCGRDLFPWVSPTAIHVEPLRGTATLFWKRSTKIVVRLHFSHTRSVIARPTVVELRTVFLIPDRFGYPYDYEVKSPREVAAAFAGRRRPEYTRCEAEAVGKTAGGEKGTSWG